MKKHDRPNVVGSVRLPEDMWRRLKIEAARRGSTMSEIMNRALEQELARKPEKAKNDVP